MGRPRGFDEAEVIRSAVHLFAGRAYDGISVDDLVAHLGVHRNSLYKTFGSKRGLYLAALRWHLEHQVRPLLRAVAAAPDPVRSLRDVLTGERAAGDLDLLLLAAVERAPVDDEVAAEVTAVLAELDRVAAVVLAGADGPAPPDLAYGLSATILGLRVRARAGPASPAAGAAVLDRIHPPQN
jgi:TetR/AcrR family transcriptional repressor of nem operon